MIVENKTPKYRGKLAETNLPRKKGDWVFGDVVTIRDGEHCYTSIYGYGRIDRRTLGEFIGKHDAERNEIYTGDVVTIAEEDGYFLVEFDHATAAFVFRALHDCFVMTFDNFIELDVEIVGNVYDHPLFLERRKRYVDKQRETEVPF